MENSNRSIHRTKVKKIPDAGTQGWEVHCAHCECRVRYYLLENSHGAKLEIFSLGNIYAQHLNDIACLEVKQLEFVEDEWLTPEIRQTIEHILEKYDQ